MLSPNKCYRIAIINWGFWNGGRPKKDESGLMCEQINPDRRWEAFLAKYLVEVFPSLYMSAQLSPWRFLWSRLFYCPRQEAGAEHTAETEADVREGIILPERRQLTMNSLYRFCLLLLLSFKMRVEQTVIYKRGPAPPPPPPIPLATSPLFPSKCYPFGSVKCCVHFGHSEFLIRMWKLSLSL